MRILYCLIPDFIVDFLARIFAYFVRLMRPGSEGIAESRLRGLVVGRRYGGTNTLLGRNVGIEGWHRITFGNNVRIHNNVQLLAGRNGNLSIGNNSHIARLSVVAAGGGVTIGDNCAISSFVSIFSVTNVPDPDGAGGLPTTNSPITIGNRVFIGTNAVILPGVTIGDGATVAAGAIVTGDVDSGAIVGGTPARPLRQNKAL